MIFGATEQSIDHFQTIYFLDDMQEGIVGLSLSERERERGQIATMTFQSKCPEKQCMMNNTNTYINTQ